LHAAARELGVAEVSLLGRDGELDQADPAEATGKIVAELRRVKPHVVLTFGPDGAYGHPDHIAISQLTTAAAICAAEANYAREDGPAPHRVSKLYCLAWRAGKWAASNLSAEHHRALWGSQEFYRAFSLINGGRCLESDLFEGLRRSTRWSCRTLAAGQRHRLRKCELLGTPARAACPRPLVFGTGVPRAGRAAEILQTQYSCRFQALAHRSGETVRT
jgi:hypothetical protein